MREQQSAFKEEKGDDLESKKGSILRAREERGGLIPAGGFGGHFRSEKEGFKISEVREG